MAEVSEQTKAIIERLKAEGDLIRNTGTNSLRSVKMEFAKFDGVFNSINKNISEQNQLMMRQLGMAEEAAEKARTQEQYEEVSNNAPIPAKDTDSTNPGSSASDTDRKINAMGDAISSALSLKNIALAGAGAFVGYNLLKGFVDEKTGGGFSAFEKNIGTFATDLGNTSFSDMQDTIAGFGETFGNMQTTLDSLNDNLASLNEAISYITSISWMDIANGVIMSIGYLTAYNLTMRTALRLMGKGAGTGGKGGFFRKLLAGGVTAATLRDVYGNDPEIDKAVNADANARTADAKANLTPDQKAALAGTGAFAPKPPAVAPDVMSTPPRQFTYNPDADAFTSNKTGQTLAGGADALARRTYLADGGVLGAGPSMDGTPNVNRTTPTAPRRTITPDQADALAGRGQYSPILADGSGLKAYRENQGLIKQLCKSKAAGVVLKAVPIVGAVVGVGFAIYSLVIGDYTTAALEGTSIALPSIAGGLALDIGAATTSIFHHVVGVTYNPTNPEHRDLMAKIAEDMKVAIEEYLASENVDREPTARQKANASREAARIANENRVDDPADDPFYYEEQSSRRGTRFNLYRQDGTLIRRNANSRNGAQAPYSDFLLQDQSSALGNVAMQNQIAQIEAAGTGGTVVIHAPTDARQNVTVTDGGNQVTLANISGGGGNGFGGGSNPYGLNLAIA